MIKNLRVQEYYRFRSLYIYNTGYQDRIPVNVIVTRQAVMYLVASDE